MKDFFRRTILPTLIWSFYRLWASTWRYYFHEPPELQSDLKIGQSFILAHWHGDELAVLPLVKKYSLATMTSTSKDGALIDYVIKKLGGQTSKGSSTRGAVSALKGLVRLGRRGTNMSIAVDGPKGPIYHVKSGVFELSKLTKSKIYSVGVFVEKPIIFKKSWNQAILPRPFAKVYVYFGEHWWENFDKNLLQQGQYAAQLKSSIEAAQKNAAGRLYASPPIAEKLL